MDMDAETDLEHTGNGEERVGILISSRSSSTTTGSGSGIQEPLLVKNSRLNTTSQHAIVGANVCPIESLDYEYFPFFPFIISLFLLYISYNIRVCVCRIFENDIFKQDWRSRAKAEIIQYVCLKWTFALLIGLGTGLAAFFSTIGVENIAGFKLNITNDLMLNQKYV